jgi:hypothetical protein
MESNQTNLVLITIFNDAVDAWLHHKIIKPHDYPPQYRSAIISQNLIGWDAFLRGYWSHQWAKIHQQHLSEAAQIEHHQSGQLWASHCINELWKQIESHGTIATTQYTEPQKTRRPRPANANALAHSPSSQPTPQRASHISPCLLYTQSGPETPNQFPTELATIIRSCHL